MKRIDYERKIFGMLFKTSNSLQVYLDRLLSDENLTAKQMFLMIVINHFGENYPTLKEVADKSSSSYQNVKQLALKLQEEGYVNIRKDALDRRKSRLNLTEKAAEFWKRREGTDSQEMEKLFSGCDEVSLHIFCEVIIKLQSNIEKM